MTIPWWGYVILAGLSWGTYVPIIFYGGQLLTPTDDKGNPLPGISGRLASILCVGAAYFLMAVVIPLVMMSLRDDPKARWDVKPGLVFSGLAGIAGAVGAICVIFASSAAVRTAGDELKEESAQLTVLAGSTVDPVKKQEILDRAAELQKPAAKKQFMAKYRMFIAPLIFSLAPLINTLLSLFWHPDAKTGEWAIFHFEMPGWKLPLGILFVAIGTFLVLMSKEDAENKPPEPKTPPTSVREPARL